MTGLLVENDPYEWKQAIDEIANNKELRAKIKQNAFEDVAQNHHVTNSASAWQEVLPG